MIKSILDEIAAESSTNAKIEILQKHKDNTLLKRVMYLAKSKRIKFYIKQIPDYSHLIATDQEWTGVPLKDAVESLSALYERKLTGSKAIEYLMQQLASISFDDAYVIERIIERDLKCGISTSQINKVFPDLIYKPAYQGAKSYNEKELAKMFAGGKEAISDVKEDGRYCAAVIRGGEVDLESRTGEEAFLGEAKFIKELEKFEDSVLTGELLLLEYPRYKSNGIINSLITIGRKESEGKDVSKEKAAFVKDEEKSVEEMRDLIVYRVWDKITPEEYFDKISPIPLKKRRAVLKDYLELQNLESIQLVHYEIVKSITEAKDHFQREMTAGNEGTICKAKDAEWKDGKRYSSIKMKLEMVSDLKITGFYVGTKGTKNENVISTLQVESSDRLLQSKPGGIGEEMMQYFQDNQENLLGAIVEIKSCGITVTDKGFALLHPRFIKLRDDKIEADSLQDIQENESMIKGLK